MLEHNQAMATKILTDVLHNQNRSLDKTIIKEAVEKKVEKEISAEYNLSLIKEILPVIDDLVVEILENKTDSNFITSDVPVIIVNPLGVRRAGLGDIGTVVFFPISPRKMAILYDNKLYGTLRKEINDPEYINVFNRYQYISADERILALSSKEFNQFIGNKELGDFREIFHESAKTKTNYDGIGTFLASKSRSIEYFFDIPILKLPKSLRKIPKEFRETFPRNYNSQTRLAILCRIYREDNFIEDEEQKAYWRQSQKYAKILLDYLDYYWKTPKEDCIINGELMKKLKNVPVNFFPLGE